MKRAAVAEAAQRATERRTTAFDARATEAALSFEGQTKSEAKGAPLDPEDGELVAAGEAEEKGAGGVPPPPPHAERAINAINEGTTDRGLQATRSMIMALLLW
jgi:hypothetical protein